MLQKKPSINTIGFKEETTCIQLNVKGTKGTQKDNERDSVLIRKGLGFLKIDLFNLHANLDEIGLLYGIENSTGKT